MRLSTKYMTPVIVLSDTYIVNAAEPWLIPDTSTFDTFPTEFLEEPVDFHPYGRDGRDASPSLGQARNTGPRAPHWWPLMKSYDSGHISHDPDNHHKMTMVRKEKIERVAGDIPLQQVQQGGESGQLAVVGWGSTTVRSAGP